VTFDPVEHGKNKRGSRHAGRYPGPRGPVFKARKIRQSQKHSSEDDQNSTEMSRSNLPAFKGAILAFGCVKMLVFFFLCCKLCAV
jgi:hypothetical protein